MIIINNAWSYLFDNESGKVRVTENNKKEIFKKAESVIHQASQILPDKGVLVTGDCPYDYFVLNNDNKVVTPSPLIEIIEKHGFIPVEKSIKTISLYDQEMQIPTIWIKK